MNVQNYRQVRGNNSPRGVIRSAKQAVVKETKYPKKGHVHPSALYIEIPSLVVCFSTCSELAFLS